MIVYGVALLSFCMLFGMYTGNLLGQLLGEAPPPMLEIAY